MLRACLPELLDSLAPDDPDALASRRDLRLINRVMRNRAWFERELASLLRPGDRVLELGAGMGDLGMRLNARGIALDGLDLWPRPGAWPADRSWHRTDLRTFAGFERYPIVIGNLIFHQFTDAELGQLGARLRRSARVILASEPERRRFSQMAAAALAPLLGINHVTRHDAQVSMTAGFRSHELPRLLGLDTDTWTVRCRTTILGANRMIAIRRA
jgi:hypothetical protein